MFSDTTRWLVNILFSAPTIAGALDVHRVANAITASQPIPTEAVAALGYSGCALVTIGAAGIILNELRNYAETQPRFVDNRPIFKDPKTEHAPAPFEGLSPVTRVNGVAKPAASYNYVTQAVKLNKERRVAMILIRNHDRGEPFDLTEGTWARSKKTYDGKVIKKFMSRSELNALKTKWEINSLICRLSAAKNAPHDAYDWNKIKAVAQGAPLPE